MKLNFGKLLIGAALTSALLSAALLPSRCEADSTPAPSGQSIGNVAKIDGKLSVMRANQSEWSAGFLQMPDYPQDHLRTDDKSVAALDMLVGGRIGIDKGTEIYLDQEGKATEVGSATNQTLVLKSGSVWCKFQKQDHPFRIKTDNTTVSIKGTEFVVDQQSKTTTISVLEGTVAYTEAGQATTKDAKAGTVVTLEYEKIPVVKYVDPDELRKQEIEKHRAVINEVGAFLSYSGVGGDVVYGANIVLSAIEDPEQFGKDVGASVVESSVPVVGGMLGGMIRHGGDNKKEPPLQPAENAAVAQGELKFKWKKFQDADHYFLLMSMDKSMPRDKVEWAAKVDGDSIRYPDNGLPLQPGVHYWRLIPLDDKGDPIHGSDTKAVQSEFTLTHS
jgi:hypothetical protein